MDALTPQHEDALRELCNICVGRAADALSRLLGDSPVTLDLPSADRLSVAQWVELLGGPQAPVVGARVELAGPVAGELWFLLQERDAAELSLRLDGSDGLGQAVVAPWALYETANIVAAACLNALYALTRLTVIPGVPEVVHAPMGELARAHEESFGRAPGALALSAELVLRDAPVRARILVLPREESVPSLLSAMGLSN